MSDSTFSTILGALDMEGLAPEEQESIIADISDLIFKGTMVRLVEKMDDATRDEFTHLVTNNATEEELEEFIALNVPDSTDAVTETIEEITSDILAVTKES